MELPKVDVKIIERSKAREFFRDFDYAVTVDFQNGDSKIVHYCKTRNEAIEKIVYAFPIRNEEILKAIAGAKQGYLG